MNNKRRTKITILRTLDSIPQPNQMEEKSVGYGLHFEQNQKKNNRYAAKFQKQAEKVNQFKLGRRNLNVYQSIKPDRQKQKILKNQYRSLQLTKDKLRKTSHRKNTIVSSEKSPYSFFPNSIVKMQKSVRNKKTSISEEKLPKRNLKTQSISSKVFRRLNLMTQGAIKEDEESIIESGKEIEKIKELMKKGYFEVCLEKISKHPKKMKLNFKIRQLEAYCLMKTKNYKQAIEKYKQIENQSTEKKSIFKNLTICFEILDQQRESEDYLQKYIQNFDQDQEIYFQIGMIRMKHKKLLEANEMLNKAIKINPFNMQIKIRIASLYEKMGFNEKAKEFYEAGLKENREIYLSYLVKYANLMVKDEQYHKAMVFIQNFLNGITKSKQKTKYHILQLTSILCYIKYKIGLLQQCTLLSQQIFTFGHPEFNEKALTILISIFINKHNFYDALHLLQRVPHLNIDKNALKQYTCFCQGAINLMKKKTQQGLRKLDQLKGFIAKKDRQNQFNKQIFNTYHLYRTYGEFIKGDYFNTLKQIQLQKKRQVSKEQLKILTFNEYLCKGIVAYNEKQYDQSLKFFLKSLGQYQNKKEVYLYIALVNIKLYFKCTEKKRQLKNDIMASFENCLDGFYETHNNFMAFAFYYRGLFFSYLNEFRDSLEDLDFAIQKSQDNFPQFFTLRCIILANLQNYKQAIHDISIAISLDETNQKLYEIRARCFQLEGNGNQAFLDMQTYITLKPQDLSINQLAGHLLFENGAFQDALQAFSQIGEFQKQINSQMLLTRSKTLFLVGRFSEAQQDMKKVAQAKAKDKMIFFDYQAMSWISHFLKKYSETKEDNYNFTEKELIQNLTSLENLYRSQSEIIQSKKYGKIFKINQYLIFTATLHFFLANYTKSIQLFEELIEMKGIGNIDQNVSEVQFEEEEGQKNIFINQMNYNITICYLMMKKYQDAEKYFKKCAASQREQVYEQFLGQIRGTLNTLKVQYPEIYSTRNKISKFLPQKEVPLKEGKRKLKICIPYPKVEPPQITPSFDINWILNIDIDEIQRKPEAPWISKQQDSIKFTDKIEVFSRFQLEESSVDNNYKNANFAMRNIDDEENFDISQGQSINLKDKLKLDNKVEQRLNKLMNKS